MNNNSGGVEFLGEKDVIEKRIETMQSEQPKGLIGFVTQSLGMSKRMATLTLFAVAILFFSLAAVIFFVTYFDNGNEQDLIQRLEE